MTHHIIRYYQNLIIKISLSKF